MAMSSSELDKVFDIVKDYVVPDLDGISGRIEFEGLRLWAQNCYPGCRFLFDSIIPMDTHLLIRTSDDEDDGTAIPSILTSYAVSGSIVDQSGVLLAKGLSSPCKVHEPEDDGKNWTQEKLEEAWRYALSTLGVSESAFWRAVENDPDIVKRAGMEIEIGDLSRSRENLSLRSVNIDQEQTVPFVDSTNVTRKNVSESGMSMSGNRKESMMEKALLLWKQLKVTNPGLAKNSINEYCAYIRVSTDIRHLDESGLDNLIDTLKKSLMVSSR